MTAFRLRFSLHLNFCPNHGQAIVHIPEKQLKEELEKVGYTYKFAVMVPDIVTEIAVVSQFEFMRGAEPVQVAFLNRISP